MAAPVRSAPGLRLLFFVLCRIEVLTARLLRRLLYLRRAGLRVVVVRPVTRIGSPVVVLPWRLFMRRLISHRYQLSYRFGIQKKLVVTGSP
jgi:hypothetical protein